MLSQAFHKDRRAAFLNLLPVGSFSITYSGEEQVDAGDQHFYFSVDRNFYYLTGYEKPGCYYVAYKTATDQGDFLFIPQPEPRQQLYYGKMDNCDSLKEALGISQVRFTNTMSATLSRMIYQHPYQTVCTTAIPWQMQEPKNEGERFVLELRQTYPHLQIHSLFHGLGLLRQQKHPEEIAAHRAACQATANGVHSILQYLRPGLTEGQIEAYFDFSLKSTGFTHAFPTISASGEHACVLHYTEKNGVLQDGDLILFDLGAECQHYCADVSRTYPVNGKFTPRQRMLYETVLHGLEVAISMTKPGQPKHLLQQESKKAMAKRLVELGILASEADMERHYCHGSGHFIGLYTHDVGDDSAILQPGMVFTLEPGLYFPEERIGIRIEDTILITEHGCEVLTANIPKTVEEIERR